MKRTVILPVDDDEVTFVEVTPGLSEDVDGIPIVEKGETVLIPVPPDDQLTRDLDAVTAYARGAARYDDASRTGREVEAAAARIRAASGLDEGSEQ